MYHDSKIKNGKPTQSVFISSVIGLANVLAVVVAFFATPLAYAYSIPHVQNFTTRHYGGGFEDIVSAVWFGTIALLVFFGARASLSTGLIMGAMTLAARFA